MNPASGSRIRYRKDAGNEIRNTIVDAMIEASTYEIRLRLFAPGAALRIMRDASERGT